MDLTKFHELYNFRKRSKEELEVLTAKIRNRSRSSSSSSSSDSSSSCSSRSGSSSSSSRSSRRSRRSRRSTRSRRSSSSSRSSSRSLPYSRPTSRSCNRDERLTSGYWSDDSEDNIDVIDELLEEPVNAKQSKILSRKRRRHQSSSSESSSYDTTPSTYLSEKSIASRIFRPERCVLLSQLYEFITVDDVRNFLSPFGKIQSLQLEFCEDTKVFKKSAIAEFENMECVLLALGLNGRKLKGLSTVVQPIMRKQQLYSCNRHKMVTLKVENLKESVSQENLESIFQPYGFLSLRFVSTKKDNYVEVVFDRMNNILAAFREVNDKRRFGIVVTML